jgi:hypothetical protein
MGKREDKLLGMAARWLRCLALILLLALTSVAALTDQSFAQASVSAYT